MKRIPFEFRRKLFALRCRSKRGEYLPPEEHEFCRKMFEKYPEDYRAMSAEVFEATKPYGVV